MRLCSAVRLHSMANFRFKIQIKVTIGNLHLKFMKNRALSSMETEKRLEALLV